jgi:hypothetical protein
MLPKGMKDELRGIREMSDEDKRPYRYGMAFLIISLCVSGVFQFRARANQILRSAPDVSRKTQEELRRSRYNSGSQAKAKQRLKDEEARTRERVREYNRVYEQTQKTREQYERYRASKPGTRAADIVGTSAYAMKILQLEKEQLSTKAVKDSYRKLAKLHHPDMAGSCPETKERNAAKFKEITSAYTTLLKDCELRRV